MNKPLLIITGASCGIGKHTAAKFLEHDWDVINLSRSNCELNNIININIDLSKPKLLDTISQDLINKIGEREKISIVHNAAWLKQDNALAISTEALEAQLAINIITPSQLNSLIVPFMSKDSSIIFIGSTLSTKAIPNCASYVTVKHAMLGLMRATTQDLKHTGIHCCCICPGPTDTDMLSAEHAQRLKQISLFNRLINPNEIANTIYFAADNPVINGSLIHANLGFIES